MAHPQNPPYTIFRHLPIGPSGPRLHASRNGAPLNKVNTLFNPAVLPSVNRAEIARIWATLTPWQRAAMSHLFRLYVANEICPSAEGLAESRRWERVLRIAILTGREYPVPSLH
jgi:hypothetical protein